MQYGPNIKSLLKLTGRGAALVQAAPALGAISAVPVLADLDVGVDGNKKIKGCKRHIVTDTNRFSAWSNYYGG